MSVGEKVSPTFNLSKIFGKWLLMNQINHLTFSMTETPFLKCKVNIYKNFVLIAILVKSTICIVWHIHTHTHTLIYGEKKKFYCQKLGLNSKLRLKCRKVQPNIRDSTRETLKNIRTLKRLNNNSFLNKQHSQAQKKSDGGLDFFFF